MIARAGSRMAAFRGATWAACCYAPGVNRGGTALPGVLLRRERALLTALVLLTNGCGAARATDDPAASGGAAGMTGEGEPDEPRGFGGSSTGRAGNPPRDPCADYRDQPPESDFDVAFTVLVVNIRSTPIYLAAPSCSDSRLAYLQFSHRGEPISLEEPTTFAFPCVACSEGASDACDLSCSNQRLIKIEAGGAYELGPFEREVEVKTSPFLEGCVPDPDGDDGERACYRLRTPYMGDYEVSAFALTAESLADPSRCGIDALESGSDCEPDTMGSCQTTFLCPAASPENADAAASLSYYFPASIPHPEHRLTFTD